ncbi:phosphate acetyltransferase [Megalodesulfovibrio gigas]|uniref:Phosphate acetyltransferase n=1 Tax=Megalodesulfovibrio gigas (strain ATCC 19364 / DSM 1382 / NCIMB 9332 / VKM B-1759) TaxID=1121448 RepID=T2G9J5_MEGG1|nr:phosphate acetyltransferase [Megalodesulfovibrio gigas]AGW13265.1 putative phosphate acetyltransferase [Megalodesulfovibrio gigas DSM 1382 = ATCC 19364]
MVKNLYIIGTEPRTGKSAIALGLTQMLLRDVQRVAFFRPIISGGQGNRKDHDINLILSQFYLNQRYEDTYAFTLAEARDIVNRGEHALLVETILNKYKGLERRFDFVLCEGTDFLGSDPAFEVDINSEIAANLGAPVLLVTNAQGKSPEEIVSSTQLAIDGFEEKGLDILATIINRAEVKDKDYVLSQLSCKFRSTTECLHYVIPEEPSLGKPTVKDVAKWLDAEVLIGREQLDAQVDDYLVAAMQVGNFLDYISKNCLVVTPGDRSDIILSCYASRQSTEYPDMAGIVLTGGIEPQRNIRKLIEGWSGNPMPVLLTKGHTFKTARVLMDLYGRIEADDQKKIATALGTFETNVDVNELRTRLEAKRSTRVTPKMFEYSLIEKAKNDRKHIVLPEGSSGRILKAADILLRRGVVDLTILGDPDQIRSDISQMSLDLSAAHIVSPAKSPLFDAYVNTFYDMRKAKGMTMEVARDTMADPTYFGTMMVKLGHAHGMVSGSITTTAQTIRPAFQIIKTKPGASIVSSVFLMCLSDRVLVFGDCAVIPNPNAKELADIAIQSAETAMIFGVEPRVAMLSYSTGESGSGEDVDKVREATKLVRELRPELLVEGPLQYDAAANPDVAATKLPGSAVAGKATVFIFPDLNTGNNTYKAVQQSAGAVAIGPVLQGLNMPVNDLSRGCTVDDIVNTVAITAIQAQAVQAQGK